jgi:hypothetical protein
MGWATKGCDSPLFTLILMDGKTLLIDVDCSAGRIFVSMIKFRSPVRGETMLNFTVIGASLTEEFGGADEFLDEIESGPRNPVMEPKGKARLDVRVKIADNQKVSLTEGGRLDKLSGTVSIYPHAGDLQRDRKSIGVMSYSPPYKPEDSIFRKIPARYWIRVSLPQSQFDPLIAAACLGRVPSGITITARGIQLTDEMRQSWDTGSSPVLPVASISFSIPLSGGETHQEQEESVHTAFPPPDQSQIHGLGDGMGRHGPKKKYVSTGLMGLFALITGFGVVAFVSGNGRMLEADITGALNALWQSAMGIIKN